jgi:hypothetical protein
MKEHAKRVGLMNMGPLEMKEPEWNGAGLPPVGSDQTVFVPSTAISAGGALNSDSRWEVVAHRGDSAVVCIDEYGRGEYRATMVPSRFCRPIRTQAHRERDEVVDEALGFLGYKTASQHEDATNAGWMKSALRKMYDAGMLRRAGE